MIRNALKSTVFGLAGLFLLAGSGCSSTSLFGYIPAIPVEQIPNSMLGRPKEDMQKITVSRLRQAPRDVYQLGPGDILGIYIDTILPKSTGSKDYAPESPPTHFPEEGERDPTIGFPMAIREDGTLALPLIPPLNVDGLTLAQATELIRKAYTIDKQLLAQDRDQIIVTLIKRRTHQVIVIRQDNTNPGGGNNVVTHIDGDQKSKILELPQGDNDLLHALDQTGGLPGFDAKNEVLILRSNGIDGREWDNLVASLQGCRQPCTCPPPIPDAPNVIRIPLRFYPENVPNFTEEDITLYTGDIVMIESREQEKFYTGGVLSGGEFPIPRDYDLDILGAIAIAGGPVGSSGAVLSQSGLGGSGRSGGQRGGPLPPTDAVIIRELCDGSQVSIRVDLKRVYNDPRQRILIQPEDVVILRYKCVEETVNTALSLIQFNFLFNGLRGNGF